MTVECPACNHKIIIGGHPRIGQRVTCSACRAELAVIWLDPIELDFPYDDDDDDYEDNDDD